MSSQMFITQELSVQEKNHLLQLPNVEGAKNVSKLISIQGENVENADFYLLYYGKDSFSIMKDPDLEEKNNGFHVSPISSIFTKIEIEKESTNLFILSHRDEPKAQTLLNITSMHESSPFTSKEAILEKGEYLNVYLLKKPDGLFILSDMIEGIESDPVKADEWLYLGNKSWLMTGEDKTVFGVILNNEDPNTHFLGILTYFEKISEGILLLKKARKKSSTASFE